jgi:L-fucose isomerase-like protein
MRNPKALVIPFRFREGYPDDIVDSHTDMCRHLLNEMKIDLEISQNVIFTRDADEVIHTYNLNNFDLLILLIPTWIEPILVMRIVSRFKEKPVIIWGTGTFEHNGERIILGSIPGAGVVKGTLREHGIYHEFVYSLPGDKKIDQRIKKRIWRLANISRAISLLNEARIITIGYLYGGVTVGDMDLTKMNRKFGPEIIEFDAFSLINRMQKLDIDSGAFKNGLKEIKDALGSPPIKELEQIARMYVGLKEIVAENNAEALTIKCNFELSQEFGLTACIPLSVIGNRVVASCEADIPVVLTQLLLHYLSGGETTSYVDVHEILDDRILVAACGFAPGNMCVGNKVIPDLPSEDREGLGATFGTYITNKNHLREGYVTLARILKESEGGFSLHTANGRSVGDIGKFSEIGCPQYPFTEIILSTNVDQFAQNMGSHHYAIVYKELQEDLELFCKIKNLRFLAE